MSHCACAIANDFTFRTFAENREITATKLVRLTYLAHGSASTFSDAGWSPTMSSPRRGARTTPRSRPTTAPESAPAPSTGWRARQADRRRRAPPSVSRRR